MTSASETVAALLDRIADVDPLTNAVCTLAEDASSQAAGRDRARADGAPGLGRLHGVPILVKDNIDTADMPTTAGSLALAGAPPSRDAPLVTRLRDAGMIVIGKTNLSEWANIRDPGSTSGWSAVGGLTRNPHALNRSPGGSSSGSGAAVAAGLAPVAIGTETDGSITCPAAFNGCVGIKPTVGLVPTEGIVPISSSQDAPGPLARSVRDAAAVLSVLAGDGIDYAAHAVEGRLAGKRIGVPRKVFWGYSDAADRVAEEALDLLSAAGATIVDNTDLEAMVDYGDDDELHVLLAELDDGLRRYLPTRSGDVPRTLAEVVEFNRAHADEELLWFGQAFFEQALTTPGVESDEYAAARAACLRHGRDEGTDAVLGAHGLDALVAPSYAPAVPIDLINPEHHPGACTQPSAMAGHPIVTVPAGMVHELPVAVSFWSTTGSERTLIEIAHGFEVARNNAAGPWPMPGFAEFV